jgi:hypothetical protein
MPSTVSTRPVPVSPATTTPASPAAVAATTTDRRPRPPDGTSGAFYTRIGFTPSHAASPAGIANFDDDQALFVDIVLQLQASIAKARNFRDRETTGRVLSALGALSQTSERMATLLATNSALRRDIVAREATAAAPRTAPPTTAGGQSAQIEELQAASAADQTRIDANTAIYATLTATLAGDFEKLSLALATATAETTAMHAADHLYDQAVDSELGESHSNSRKTRDAVEQRNLTGDIELRQDIDEQVVPEYVDRIVIAAIELARALAPSPGVHDGLAGESEGRADTFAPASRVRFSL